MSQQSQAIAQSSGWRSALAVSCVAVYGPFVLMALYTLAFVPCGHCKATVWKLLLPGPGIVFLEIFRQAINTPRLPDGISFVIGTLIALCVVAGIARLGGFSRGWLIGASIAAFVLSSVAALGLLAAIRS